MGGGVLAPDEPGASTARCAGGGDGETMGGIMHAQVDTQASDEIMVRIFKGERYGAVKLRLKWVPFNALSSEGYGPG